MKKMDMSKIFDIIIAICVLCAVASFAKEFFANSAYESETGREILSMVDFESYNGSIINECDATAHYMNKLESELSLLPESLVSQYQEDGNIHVVTEIRECVNMPAKFDYIDQISGVYVYSDSNIYMHYNASHTSDGVNLKPSFFSMPLALSEMTGMWESPTLSSARRINPT